jgi:hypothetical protein
MEVTLTHSGLAPRTALCNQEQLHKPEGQGGMVRFRRSGAQEQRRRAFPFKSSPRKTPGFSVQSLTHSATLRMVAGRQLAVQIQCVLRANQTLRLLKGNPGSSPREWLRKVGVWV